MENLIIMLFVCFAVPLALMLPMFRGRSRYVVALFITGMFMCAFAGDLNTAICKLGNFSEDFAVVNITPLVEEIIKTLPAVFVVLVFKPKRQTVLECSIAASIGFATLENADILFESTQISMSYILIRAFGAGLVHAVSGIIIGYAISFITIKKKLAFPLTLGALSLTMIYHSVFNILITSDYSFIGCILPIISLIPIVLVLPKHKKYLFSEKSDENKKL